MKVEFFNHRTLGQAAKVTAKTHTHFFILDGVWRDADSAEAVVLTKIPQPEWTNDVWLVPAAQQQSARL